MEYEKMTNFLDNATNKPSKFRTKNMVEINDDSRWNHNTNSQIKFKTSMQSPFHVVIVMHIYLLKKL